MVDGQCGIIHKLADKADLDNQRLLSAHALTLVLNGGLMVHTDDGLPIKVERGHMVLLPKGLYAITDLIPKEAAFEAVVFFFDDELIEQFLMSKGMTEGAVETGPRPSCFKVNRSFHQFVTQLVALYGQVEVDATMTQLKLREALYLIDSKDPSGQFLYRLQALRTKPKKELRQFMSAHFDKPLDVESFASLCGRSVASFRRDFHKEFQCSPKKWLIRQRLAKAKKLLEQGKAPITSIANQSGYTDIPHFIKSFHKEFALSPMQFALRHQEKFD